jgi:hypothetical protein
MSTTTAYYTTETADPEEPQYHDVTVTTEHSLSSYGQPVVIDAGEATPAQSWGHALYLYYRDVTDAARDLVAKANRLSGHGDGATVAETRQAFAGFFAPAEPTEE